ncbi:MAG: tetratricopeptide repeat protein [Terracidiphilus sp.]
MLSTLIPVKPRCPLSVTLMGLLLTVSTEMTANASCTVPTPMKANLERQPTAENFTRLGEWFGGQKQFQCAAKAFASAVKLRPDSASLTYMWGLSLYSAGQIDEAIGPLRQAARLDPQDVRPHLVLGEALDQINQTANAEGEWRAALAIDPGSATALDGLSRDLLNDKEYAATIALLGQSSHPEQRTAMQNLNLGMAYAKTLQLSEAASVLHAGLDAAPNSLPLANELALVLMLLGRSEEADTVLSAALAKHPGELNVQILYLRVLITSKSERAPALGHKLLLTAPRNWEVLYLNAQLEMRAGELREARAHLEQSVALNSGYFQSQEALGNVLSELKDFSAARERLEKAIELGDTEPAVQYELARVLQSLGLADQAQERLRVYQAARKAEADRTLAVGKIEAGDKAMASGDAAQAVSLYQDAVANDPNEALPTYKLAKALEKANDLAGERAALQRAIELDPNLAEAQNQMGYLETKSGEDAKAESYFRAAVHASPSYLQAWINLAAALAGESKWEEAKQALARVLELDPTNAKARQLDQAITAIQANP